MYLVALSWGRYSWGKTYQGASRPGSGGVPWTDKAAVEWRERENSGGWLFLGLAKR